MGHARGYRGCLLDEEGYLFFQLTRNGRLRRLKRYPQSDFDSNELVCRHDDEIYDPGGLFAAAGADPGFDIGRVGPGPSFEDQQRTMKSVKR